MRRAAVYARTSSVERTVDQQLARLRELAPGAEEFVDAGVSGSLRSRPAFDRLVAGMRSGGIGEVYVTRLDRLGRSVVGILEFFELARKRDVPVYVVDQAIDTSTPAGRFLLASLAAVAELERDLAIERTKEKISLIREGKVSTRSGRPIGRPRRATPEVVARIHTLRAAGMKWSTVAQHVGLPAGTCRKFPPPSPRATPRAENPLADFGAPSSGLPRGSEQSDSSV